MVICLFKGLHSFFYISLILRKLFNDMYYILKFFKKNGIFSYILIKKLFDIVDINKKLCRYLDTYTKKLQWKSLADLSSSCEALGILMIKNINFWNKITVYLTFRSQNFIKITRNNKKLNLLNESTYV